MCDILYETLMTKKEIQEEIDFERTCNIDTLLQNLIYHGNKVNVFRVTDKKGKNKGYKIRDKQTYNNVQL